MIRVRVDTVNAMLKHIREAARKISQLSLQKHFSGPEHKHGAVDPTIMNTERGKHAVKWSFIGLMITALFQVLIFCLSGSVALLADTVHNFGDAFTAIPLWIAFSLASRKPTKRFTYGYGRVEDLAGVMIILVISFSAILAGHESIVRLWHPEPIRRVWTVIAASLIGFTGNEIVARFRVRTGRQIKSAALVADGHHARVDGLTSLGVLFSALGMWLGFPLADPIVGLVITLVIIRIVWKSGKTVFTRLLDGVNPELVDNIKDISLHTAKVQDVTDVRIRWLGHRLHAEVNLAVMPDLSVAEAHRIAVNAQEEILRSLPFLSDVVIHIDPQDASGKKFHAALSPSR